MAESTTVYGIFQEGEDTPIILSMNKQKLSRLIVTLPTRFRDSSIKEYDVKKVDVAKTRRKLEDKIRKMGTKDMLLLAEELDIVFALLTMV